MLHVFQGEYDWVIAKSKDDAMRVECETMGITPEDYGENDFEQISDDKSLEICFPDGLIELKTRHKTTLKISCGDWVKLMGRCLLCSTEY